MVCAEGHPRRRPRGVPAVARLRVTRIDGRYLSHRGSVASSKIGKPNPAPRPRMIARHAVSDGTFSREMALERRRSGSYSASAARAGKRVAPFLECCAKTSMCTFAHLSGTEPRLPRFVHGWHAGKYRGRQE